VPRTTIVDIPPVEQAWMLAELRRARYGYLLALHLLLLCAAGHAPTEIAAVRFCSRSTVYRVVKAYRAGELEWALEEEAPGCPQARRTILSPALKRSIRAILQAVPRTCGWCRTRWSCATVALELQARRGVAVSAETVRRWLHALGWEWKRAKLVAKVLAAVSSLKYRRLLFCAYGAGLRVGEACKLCPGDLDSQRRVLHVRAGKGGRDRSAMLSPVLLDSLRQYYRQEHPEKPFLFPRATPGKPAPVEGVQTTLRMALAHSGVSKRITPHTLRHAFATHSLESGTDLRVIPVLLGPANLHTTTRYVHVSTKLIASTRSPRDAIAPQSAQHANNPQDQTQS
jgi:integrase